MKNLLFVLLALLLLFFLYKKFLEPAQLRAKLKKWVDNSGAKPDEIERFKKVLDEMSGQELKDVNDFVFDYLKKGLQLPPGDLRNRVETISRKYNIFT